MNAPEKLPMGLVPAPQDDEPMTAERYQREAIATAQSEAMDPDNEPAEDFG